MDCTVIAWIWARTVTCPNPACAGIMPLVRSFWLGQSPWDAGRIVAPATCHETRWVAMLSLPDLESVLSDAADGLPSDITIGGESGPATIDGDELQIPIGPAFWNARQRRPRSIPPTRGGGNGVNQPLSLLGENGRPSNESCTRRFRNTRAIRHVR